MVVLSHPPSSAAASGFGRMAQAMPFVDDPTVPLERRDIEAALWRSEARQALADGDARRALHAWNRVRRLQPRALDALFHLGCCFALMRRPGPARHVFATLARMDSAPNALRSRAARLAAMLQPAPH